MKLQSDTKEIQELLGNYCKTGKLEEIPGLTEGRVHHYRRLVYNVVKSTMDQAYPITRSALNDETWDEMVNDFFSKHTTASPQIWKLPYDFYQFHFSSGTSERLEMPFLNDLLYFEWVEIEIHTMADIETEPYSETGDVLNDVLYLNPEHQMLQLEYPVHKEAVKLLDRLKGEYFVLVFREPETGNVRFIDLSVLHAFILIKISETAAPVQRFKGEIAQLAGIESETYLDDFLTKFLSDLMKIEMILGYLD